MNQQTYQTPTLEMFPIPQNDILTLSTPNENGTPMSFDFSDFGEIAM